jgi:hypothetical protein
VCLKSREAVPLSQNSKQLARRKEQEHLCHFAH